MCSGDKSTFSVFTIGVCFMFNLPNVRFSHNYQDVFLKPGFAICGVHRIHNAVTHN